MFCRADTFMIHKEITQTKQPVNEVLCDGTECFLHFQNRRFISVGCFIVNTLLLYFVVGRGRKDFCSRLTNCLCDYAVQTVIYVFCLLLKAVSVANISSESQLVT